MGLLQRGQAALIRRQKQADGRTVTYQRGAERWTLTAWTGKQLFAREATDVNGATVVHGEADYLFAVADARAAGLPLPPAEGDRITDPTVLDATTGAGKVFELATPTGESCWRWADNDHTTVRVHCRRAG